MYDLRLNYNEQDLFDESLEKAKDFSKDNSSLVGIGEMAIGASLIAWGVQNGAIEMGAELVGTMMGHPSQSSIVGAVGGSSAGLISGAILGSIGVAAGGTAIGIPAALIMGGGSLVLGLAGYAVGDMAHKMLLPSMTLEFLKQGSILAVGLALLIDGARKCLKDQKILAALSKIQKWTITLSKLAVDVVARSVKELKEIAADLRLGSRPDSKVDLLGSVLFTLGGYKTGSIIGGGLVAASSVTFAGSEILGVLALKLGIISTPIWPVMTVGTAIAILGYVFWKFIKYILGKQSNAKLTSRLTSSQ